MYLNIQSVKRFCTTFIASLAFTLLAAPTQAASIASIEKIKLGGMEQSVAIYGEDTSKPVLLILHGGPGFSEFLFFHSYNRELEKSFVVVNWDQRGTGLSYVPGMTGDSLHISQMEADAHELTGMLKKRFGQQKIFLLGHSWGTMLGALTARDHPEDYFAYIGVCQISDMAGSEKISMQYVLQRARADHNAKAVAELEAIAPGYPRHGAGAVDDLKKQREWLAHYGGVFHGPMDSDKMFAGITAPEKTLYSDELNGKGESLSLASMWNELLNTNLMQSAPEFRLPVYFLLGRADYNVAAPLSEQYFHALKAPRKQLIWFEQSGHFVPFEEPAKFNQFMRSQLLRENGFSAN
jgi:pimeloyl-ACP methyl ester carboxylesterase